MVRVQIINSTGVMCYECEVGDSESVRRELASVLVWVSDPDPVPVPVSVSVPVWVEPHLDYSHGC